MGKRAIELRGLALAAVLLLIASTGCDSSSRDSGTEAAALPSNAAGDDLDQPSGQGTDAAADDSGVSPGTAEGPQSETGSSAEDPAGAPGKPGKLPPPANLPGKAEVPVRGAVKPSCVRPGGLVTLTVETKPEAAIGYQAVYADGRGGGGAPFGAGYGGNDKGFADGKGQFTSSWTLSLDAPPGIGRVDVIIAYRGEWGYDDPPFAVADSDGECSAR